MTTALTANRTSPLDTIVEMVTTSVTSVHTQRAYRRALVDFMEWHGSTGQQGLSKATVNAYVAYLREEGTSASSINQRLVAIRKLAREAVDNELITSATADAIARAQGVRAEGKRLGNWLSQAQAQKLIDAPDVTTTKGRRDHAMLAVLLGCGLRREELVSLTVEHIQQRDGRWVIVDLMGKRNKRRSVPMPNWGKAAVDEWLEVGNITSGHIFRPVSIKGEVADRAMSTQAVYKTVDGYAKSLGLTIHPHDLRRTFAKLAHKGKAPLEQIQLSLGHSSVQTTERYLGVTQDLTSAPCDVLGLRA